MSLNFFLDKNMLKKKKSLLLFLMNSNSATLIFFSLQLHSKITGEDACHLYVSSAIKLNCKKVECLLGRKSCGLLQWITKTLSLSSERPLQGRYFCALWWELLVFNFFSYGKCHIREKLNQGFLHVVYKNIAL